MFFLELLFNIFQLCTGMRTLKHLCWKYIVWMLIGRAVTSTFQEHTLILSGFPKQRMREECRKKEHHIYFYFHLLTASATQINMYSYSWGNVCVLSTCGYLAQLITNKSKLRAFLLNQWLKVHRNTFGNKNTQNEKLFNSRSCWITKYKSIHIIHYNRFYTHITCYTMLNLPVWPFPSEIRERRNYMSNKCGYVDRHA